MKSDSQTHGPPLYRGRDAVYRFLANLLYHEKVMRAVLTAKMSLVMTPEEWRETRYTCTTPTPAGTSVTATKRAITEKLAKTAKRKKLLLKKSIYPYEYMDSFERFDEAGLLAKEEFFSKLVLG